MRKRDDKFPDNGFEAWGGYMHAKVSKLEEQFSARANTEGKISSIFSGVSIYVNGYTTPSADELKELMSKHGGVYHTYQRTEDYIIASNLPDTKVKNMSLSRVVTPLWITDSIASNKLLDYRNYLLYQNSRTQPRLQFCKISKNASSDGLPSQVSTSTLKMTSDTDQCKNPKLENNDTVKENIDGSNSNDNHISDNINVIKASNATTKTAADPNFITEFYNNSRLHHISQLGACFKQYVNDLRDTSDFKFPAREDLKNKCSVIKPNQSQIAFEKGSTIMHIDMDCFFVSVGLRNRPDLCGKPVAVTHSKGGQARSKRSGVDRSTEFNLYRQKQAKKMGKDLVDNDDFETTVDNIGDEDDKFGSMSEIASCSYEARAKGITNGMFMGSALRLCPDLQTIPYDFDGYKEVAYTLYNTIAQYTLNIEAVSCDEMYVDCTDLLKELGICVQDFATILRNKIKSKTACPCSTGFGGNRLQARLATKKAKPDGQFFLSADLVEDFMFDIRLKDLPGVGRQIAQKLEALGHETCGSLQNLSLTMMQRHLGNKTGAQLFDQCRGRDENPLTFHTIRKSVSAEVNYGIRFENNDQCTEFLKQLSAEVHLRMQQAKVLGKCITLKLMVRAEEAPLETAKFMGHGFCNVINKSTTLNNATNDVDVITREVILICKKQNIDPKEMRGIGIQITKLELINSFKKQVKGTINKFLCNKTAKSEFKEDIDKSSKDMKSHNANNSNISTSSSKTISPKKSSSLIKSPSAKRRGRPPKNIKTRLSTTNNLSKFLQGQSTYKDPPYRSPIIKKELVVKEEKVQTQPVETPQGLLGLPWEKVRELLRAWLDSGQEPLQCDVDLIINYMREMVVTKKIDKLNILINFLKRRTKEMETFLWTLIYEKIIQEIQNAMVAVYGKKLYIAE